MAAKLADFALSTNEEGMVIVKSMKCEHPGCVKVPSFNAPGSRAGRFCSEHKEGGMVDVKYKKG